MNNIEDVSGSKNRFCCEHLARGLQVLAFWCMFGGNKCVEDELQGNQAVITLFQAKAAKQSPLRCLDDLSCCVVTSPKLS